MQISYVIGLGLNLGGLLTASSTLRQIARPFCGGSLALLLLSWHQRIGWVNVPFACLVLCGLLCTVFGDVILAQPVQDYLDYTGFLFHIMSLLCFISAFSMPSLPDNEKQLQHRERQRRGIYTMLREAAYGRAEEKLKPMRHAPAVPLLLSRAVLPLVVSITGLVLWRVLDGSSETHDPRFIATACIVTLQCVLVWRALARVGYAAPLVTVAGLRAAAQRRKSLQADGEEEEDRPSILSQRIRSGRDSLYGGDSDAFALGFNDDDDAALGVGVVSGSPEGSGRGGRTQQVQQANAQLRQQRAARNARQYDEDASAVESRWWQWCGVWGAVLLAASLLLLGYDRLWVDDDQSQDGFSSYTATWLTYGYTLLSWAGQTLIVSSVPCDVPPAGALDDPQVSPGPTEGQSLRVLIVIPSTNDFDMAEVAATWHYLSKRGHTVLFATRDGYPGVKQRGVLPMPFEPSVHGYGVGPVCGSGASTCCSSTCCRRGHSSMEVTHRLPPATRQRRSGGGSRTGTSPRSPAPLAATTGPSLLRVSSSRARRGGESCVRQATGVLCGDMLRFSAMSIGVGAPPPLVVALYRELLEDPSFRKPFAWSVEAMAIACAAMPRRAKRRVPHGRSHHPHEGGSPASSYYGHGAPPGSPRHQPLPQPILDAIAEYTEYCLAVESFDGVIIVGAHPVSVHSSLWSEPDLGALVSRFWDTGRPLACFANAQQLLARIHNPKSGAPLAANAMLTCMPSYMEVTVALLLALYNCRWDALGQYWCKARAHTPPARQPGQGEPCSVQSEVEASLRLKANFVRGASPFSLSACVAAFVKNDVNLVRQPNPFDERATVVVESENLLTAQCGGDAFVLAKRFASKLEVVQRIF